MFDSSIEIRRLCTLNRHHPENPLFSRRDRWSPQLPRRRLPGNEVGRNVLLVLASVLPRASGIYFFVTQWRVAKYVYVDALELVTTWNRACTST